MRAAATHILASFSLLLPKKQVAEPEVRAHLCQPANPCWLPEAPRSAQTLHSAGRPAKRLTQGAPLLGQAGPAGQQDLSNR